MANEAQIHVSLLITKSDTGYLNYQSMPQAFTADVGSTLGPVPGALVATPTGTLVDLSALTTPGLCWIRNNDLTETITIGAWDPETEKFYPLLDLLPGEFFPLRLSALLGWEYGTGTGTNGSQTNRIMVRSQENDCDVQFHAFEK